MRLLNYTTAFFAGLLLVIIAAWSIVFYNGMVDLFYDEITEGLVNQKQLIIHKAQTDSSILKQAELAEGNFSVHEIDFATARLFRDAYIDTMLYMPSEGEPEPVRLLKTAFLKNNRYYMLTVASSTVGEDNIVRELFHKLLWLYFGLVASILVLNNFLLKKTWSPFYKLLYNLENFSLDDPEPIRVKQTNIHEFNLLNKTVDKMISHNVSIYNSQKQFIENASHELQTPLAISLNKLETLAGNEGLSEDNFNLLSDAINSLERLTRLNRSLLMLSKINNRQFEDVRNVNMNELVEKAVIDFGDQARFSNVSILVSHEEKSLLKVNPDLASVLVNNLIKNAIVHNYNGGTVKVYINSKFLRVENTGKSAALNGEKMFERFYKESQSSHSTGLGLSIVKAIADLYNFSTNYTYNTRHVITIGYN